MTVDPRAALLDETGLTLEQAVIAISRIPYGRPTDRSPRGVLQEWRGTCSTKHDLLVQIVEERWPECQPQLWHRVYRVTPELAQSRWGAGVAAAVPTEGLTDVHTYSTLLLDDHRVRVDVTMPLEGWDGHSHIPLACGDGEDHSAGPDPASTKATLVARHCDEALRERFIEALSTS